MRSLRLQMGKVSNIFLVSVIMGFKIIYFLYLYLLGLIKGNPLPGLTSYVFPTNKSVYNFITPANKTRFAKKYNVTICTVWPREHVCVSSWLYWYNISYDHEETADKTNIRSKMSSCFNIQTNIFFNKIPRLPALTIKIN